MTIEFFKTSAIIHPNSSGNFLSNVFTVNKKDGGKRMILNLKCLNESVFYRHCKLESLNDVLNMVKQNVWVGSIDLKYAYYSMLCMVFILIFTKFSLFNGKVFSINF